MSKESDGKHIAEMTLAYSMIDELLTKKSPPRPSLLPAPLGFI